MKFDEFNKLRSREKWNTWESMLNTTWHCPNCGEEDESKPIRCSPISGASRHCGGCEDELTYRTGGGQGDPFYWIAKEKITDETLRELRDVKDTINKLVEQRDNYNRYIRNYRKQKQKLEKQIS